MLNTALIKYGFLAAALVVYTGVCYHKGAEDATRKAELKASELREAVNKEKIDALVEHTEQLNRLSARATASDAARLASEKALGSRLAAQLDRLRDRPERPAEVSSAPRPSCTGANGAELAGSDARLLVWYAAQAARQDAALEQCYSRLDDFRAAVQTANAASR